MACRGVFFAITQAQAKALLTIKDDASLMVLIENIEQAWDEDNLAECDKAWDAMHRCLTDGKLDFGNGPYPLNHCVLSPQQLFNGDDYIVSFVAPEKVSEVASALKTVTIEWFQRQYRTVVPKDYALEYGEDDLEYTWDWFQGVRELYIKAAAQGRAVIFTVDQ